MNYKQMWLSVLNLFLFLGVLTINTLAVTLPLNGKSTAELSDQYPNLFVPAGFTFSIWGVIYLLLLVFVSYQMRSIFKKTQTLSTRTQTLFAITCLLNICWILSWHYQFVLLSVLIMLTLLVTLILLFINIQKNLGRTFLEKMAIETPINIYLGWISVATIANVTALLVYFGWHGGMLSESTWAILLLFVGSILGLFMLFIKNNFAYISVIIWAFWGIYSKRIGSENPEIAKAAIIMIGVMTICFIYVFVKKITPQSGLGKS
jgi:TspO/MBR family